MRKFLLFTLLMTISAGFAFAGEYPYIYKGMRPMGMGGAFTAVSDDANALFYNPAGLAYAKKIRVSVLPLDVEVGKNTMDVYKDAKDVDFDDEVATAEFLREYVGDRAHLGLNLFPYFSMPGFALALIGTARADLEVYDRQYPKVYTNAVNDIGGGVGYARSILDDSLAVGASMKFIHRQSLTQNYTVLDISEGDFSDKVDDDLMKGNGVLLDLGVIYSLADVGFGNARVGLSANNLIGNKLGDAQNVDDHIDIGFAVDQDVWITKATFAVDYMDIFNQIDTDSDMFKRVRMGVEVKLPMFLSVRAGFYQGYYTAGVSMDAKLVQLDALTYAEEIGAYAGQRADRRYELRFLLGF